MSQRTRVYLKDKFQNGDRPTQADFGDFIDSVFNYQDDDFPIDVSGSFIDTGSFVLNSSTGSFVLNSQTGSFVRNGQTGSFITNDQTGSFITNDQTGSMTVASASHAATASYLSSTTKIYRAKVSQVSASAPTVVVMQDDITGMTYSRVARGEYRLTKTGAFADPYVHAKINAGLFTGRHPNASGAGTDTTAAANIYAIAVHTTGGNAGKIIIGGDFTYYNGTAVNKICRINVDGTLDTTFNPSPATGFNGTVRTIAFNNNETVIYVGGEFTSYNGTSANKIISLNTSNGSINGTFTYGTGFTGTVYKIKHRADSTILVMGSLSDYDSTPIDNVVSLLPTGVINPDFSLTATSGAAGTIYDATILSDNSIIFGGSFTFWDGNPVVNITKSTDSGSFAPFAMDDTLNGIVKALGRDNSDNIYLGGAFTAYSGSLNRIMSLASNGSTNTTFNTGTGAGADVETLLVYPATGDVIIGGVFSTYNGTSRNHIAKINSTGTLDTTFNLSTSVSSPAGNVYTIHKPSTNENLYFGGIFTAVFDLSLPVHYGQTISGIRGLVKTSKEGIVDIRMFSAVCNIKIRRVDNNNLGISTDVGSFLFDGILDDTEIEIIQYPNLT